MRKFLALNLSLMLLVAGPVEGLRAQSGSSAVVQAGLREQLQTEAVPAVLTPEGLEELDFGAIRTTLKSVLPGEAVDRLQDDDLVVLSSQYITPQERPFALQLYAQALGQTLDVSTAGQLSSNLDADLNVSTQLPAPVHAALQHTVRSSPADSREAFEQRLIQFEQAIAAHPTPVLKRITISTFSDDQQSQVAAIATALTTAFGQSDQQQDLVRLTRPASPRALVEMLDHEFNVPYRLFQQGHVFLQQFLEGIKIIIGSPQSLFYDADGPMWVSVPVQADRTSFVGAVAHEQAHFLTPPRWQQNTAVSPEDWITESISTIVRDWYATKHQNPSFLEHAFSGIGPTIVQWLYESFGESMAQQPAQQWPDLMGRLDYLPEKMRFYAQGIVFGRLAVVAAQARAEAVGVPVQDDRVFQAALRLPVLFAQHGTPGQWPSVVQAQILFEQELQTSIVSESAADNAFSGDIDWLSDLPGKGGLEEDGVQDTNDRQSIRSFGSTGLQFNVAGVGTIWIGRQWPVGNANYTDPAEIEIDAYFDTAFEQMQNADGMVHIDTAPAYGLTEERLGQYFGRRPEHFARAFVATKWGEEYDAGASTQSFDFSVEHLKRSFDRSVERLGKVNLLYLHGPTLEALRDQTMIEEMVTMRERGEQGLQAIGASLSDEAVLEAAAAEGLLDALDVIQMPAPAFLKRPEFWTEQLQGKAIVLNSPVRGGSASAQESIVQVLEQSGVSMVLFGSRGHYQANIDTVAAWADGGLEEQLSRRSMLGRTTAAVAAPLLLSGDAAAQQVTALDQLKQLSQQMGRNRVMVPVVWGNPADLLKTPEFFADLGRAKQNALYVSAAFADQPRATRQRIVDEAKKAGVPTLGFILGAPDWVLPQKYPSARARLKRLTDAIVDLDLGNQLKIAFITDIEPYTRKQETGWNGDLSGYGRVLDQVFLPAIRSFAQAQQRKYGREVVAGRLTRFEPFWWEEGHVSGGGAVIRNVPDPDGTVIAGMTYRDTPERLLQSAQALLNRAVQAKRKGKDVRVVLGVETKPVDGRGVLPGLTLYGREKEMPQMLQAVWDGLTAEQRDVFGGFFLHFGRAGIKPGTRRAYEVIRGDLLGQAVERLPEQEKPVPGRAPKLKVKAVKVQKLEAKEVQLQVQVPEGTSLKGWVAGVFRKTDTYYSQGDPDFVPVGEDGTIQIRAKRSLTEAGVAQRAVVLIPAEHQQAFLKLYDGGRNQGPYKASRQFAGAVIHLNQDGSVYKVAEELLRNPSGLEEKTVLQRLQNIELKSKGLLLLDGATSDVGLEEVLEVLNALPKLKSRLLYLAVNAVDAQRARELDAELKVYGAMSDLIPALLAMPEADVVTVLGHQRVAAALEAQVLGVLDVHSMHGARLRLMLEALGVPTPVLEAISDEALEAAFQTIISA